ncbi:methyltransferase domain-containing protein [Aureococcus anophagefferens]|nr:methyltransferase domain-containing protein [Aureococcus anophagefferens]
MGHVAGALLVAVAVALEVEIPPSTSEAAPTYGLKPVQSEADLRICGAQSVRRKQLSGKYIRGVGVEIGAKHTPLPVDRRGNRVIYVDHKDDAGLAAQFGAAPAGRERLHVDVVDDGAALRKFANSSLDFVIANHVLEHLPCALCALAAWARVLKPGGIIFAAIPSMRHTLDKDRAGPTPLAHHLADLGDPARAAAFLATPAAPGLHLHTFTPESIFELVVGAATRAGVPVAQLAASRANPTECVAIIQVTRANSNSGAVAFTGR